MPNTPIEVTPQVLWGLLFFIATVILAKWPWLAAQWDKLGGDWKFAIIIVGCLVSPFIPVALACGGIVSGLVAYCPAADQVGQTIFNGVVIGMLTFAVSQGAHTYRESKL